MSFLADLPHDRYRISNFNVVSLDVHVVTSVLTSSRNRSASLHKPVHGADFKLDLTPRVSNFINSKEICLFLILGVILLSFAPRESLKSTGPRPLFPSFVRSILFASQYESAMPKNKSCAADSCLGAPVESNNNLDNPLSSTKLLNRSQISLAIERTSSIVSNGREI